MKPMILALGLVSLLSGETLVRETPTASAHPLPYRMLASCGRCMNEPYMDQFCRESCGCTSAFCGRW